MPAMPAMPAEMGSRERNSQPFIIAIFLRLLQAILWTVLITGLVLLLAWLFPKQISSIQKTAVGEPALSFATGLIVSLAALLLGGLLFVTLCLAPFSLLLWALLAVVTLVGWTVISVWLGDQVEKALVRQPGLHLHSAIPLTLGALLLTGATFFAWSLLPCLGLVAAVLIGSTGTGAVLVHLARRANLTGSTTARTDAASMEPSTVAVSYPGQTTPQPAATVDTVAASPDTVEATATGLTEAAEIPAESPAVTLATDPTADFVTGEELGLTDAERAELRQGAGIAQEADNFLRIQGIGPTLNQALADAGITTYAQLASLGVDELAAILGWPPERVVRDRLREQASELATQ